MAGCSDYGCNCLVQGENGIAVSGAGTQASPYKVSLVGGLGDALVVVDTPTVNFTLNGGGTPSPGARLGTTWPQPAPSPRPLTPRTT
jgi:hypothetical protein